MEWSAPAAAAVTATAAAAADDVGNTAAAAPAVAATFRAATTAAVVAAAKGEPATGRRRPMAEGMVGHEPGKTRRGRDSRVEEAQESAGAGGREAPVSCYF